MKPFLYQILLLTLACLVPVLCQDDSASKAIEHPGEASKGLEQFAKVSEAIEHVEEASNDFKAIHQKLTTTIDDLSKGSRITLGIVSIIAGLLFLVVGKFLIRVVFALGGGCLFGGLAFYIGRVIEKHQPPSTGLIIGVVVVAIVGGMVGFFLLKVGTILLGALAGVSLAMLIARLDLVDETAMWIIGACLVIGFCLLAVFLSNIIIVVLTSIIGSFVFMFGVDCFFKKGFGDFVVGFDLSALQVPSTEVIIMCSATLLLAVLGFLFQFCIFRKRGGSK
ncbi:hypothetical protein DSO57_1003931 [Entomophthora muscae]|uniref:Uncharacterized protein n=1 Tax=Entomophthora muscae TaxID=34485 RepID=A0ACC2RZB5_9FUNG|nr:hypothetical protein DSO57_1003931 [Entomophthora muscae]